MYYYIVNPVAGNHQFDKFQAEFLASLRLKKIEGEIAKTTSPKEAEKLARMGISKGNRMIIAVGGDATVEEVLNGVIRSEKAGVAMGIVPFGKNNYLANSLGITDWQVGLNSLAKGKIKRFDVAQANDVYFLGSLDFGLPQILRQKYQQVGPKLNFWKRFRITLDVLKNITPLKANLKVASHYRANLSLIAGSFGNTLFFNQPESFQANPDSFDQKLHALFLHPFEQKSLWYKAWEISRGNYRGIEQFSLIKEKSFSLESEQEIHFETLSNRFTATKLELKLHPKAVSLVTKAEEEPEPKKPVQ